MNKSAALKIDYEFTAPLLDKEQPATASCKNCPELLPKEKWCCEMATD